MRPFRRSSACRPACLSCPLADQKKNGAPSGAPSSSHDKGKFNIVLDGQSIGHEEFEIAALRLRLDRQRHHRDQAPAKARQQVTGNLSLQPDGIPISYDWSSQTDKSNSASITFVNGVAKITLQVQGAHPYQQENSFGSPLIAVLDNNLYHQYEVLAHVYDWNKRGPQTFPVLIPQELTPGTITVESAGSAPVDGKITKSSKSPPPTSKSTSSSTPTTD